MGPASLVLFSFGTWHMPKHEAEVRMGKVCINTSQMMLKSLRSVDLFGRSASGEALVKSRSLKV